MLWPGWSGHVGKAEAFASICFCLMLYEMISESASQLLQRYSILYSCYSKILVGKNIFP